MAKVDSSDWEEDYKADNACFPWAWVCDPLNAGAKAGRLASSPPPHHHT